METLRHVMNLTLRASFVAMIAVASGAAWAADEEAVRPPSPELSTVGGICVAYEVTEPATKDGSSAILVAVSNLIETYERLGVAADELDIHVVVHGEAARMVLVNDAWQGVSDQPANPHREDVALLLHAGAQVEVCGNTMEQNGWTEADILPAVTIVPGAVVRLVDLQSRGCAYISF